MNEIRQASPSGANGRLTEGGMIISSTQLFVLRREDSVVLIELGTGNGKTRPSEPYWDHQNLPYLETLASLNIQPEDVDYAFLSHLMFEVEGSYHELAHDNCGPLWFIGDLLHHLSQVAHPDWPSGSFAFDSDMNARQRKNYFKRFAASNAALFAVHLGDRFRIRETPTGQYFATYD
ncbi:MAG: hypothetical protein JW850_01970 [Thermoflexales bacterium]|nr:hypothetical protein [Thermoflexales bacterium]